MISRRVIYIVIKCIHKVYVFFSDVILYNIDSLSHRNSLPDIFFFSCMKKKNQKMSIHCSQLFPHSLLCLPAISVVMMFVILLHHMPMLETLLTGDSISERATIYRAEAHCMKTTSDVLENNIEL